MSTPVACLPQDSLEAAVSLKSGRSLRRTGAIGKRFDKYREAVEEMLRRTTTPYAPSTIVESNCRRYTRVKVLETVCEVIRKRLR